MVKATMRFTAGTTVSVLLLASAVICTAQPKTANRAAKQEAPKVQEGYVFPDTLLIKDLGCAKDYAKATKAEGIEQRKMLAELFKYGCVEQLRFVYYVSSTDRQAIGSVTVWKVIAVYIDRLTKPLIGEAETNRRQEELNGEYIGKAGWIAAKDFQHVTEDQMVAIIQKVTSPGAK